jgi:hypothetical protein
MEIAKIGLLFLLSVTFILLAFESILRTRGKDIRKYDSKTQIIFTIVSISFIFYFYWNEPSVIFFFFSFSLAALFLELLGNYFWYLIFGARLFRYYKNNILGMTSWYTLPYWGWGGMFFFMIYRILNISLERINFSQFLIDFAGVMFLLGLIFILFSAFSLYLTKKEKNISLEGFTFLKYAIFVLSFLAGYLYALRFLNISSFLMILLFFFASTIFGTIAEGLLGIFIKHFYGERFWVYQRYSIINKSTSLLIIPFWAAPALLALFFMNIFGLL